MNFGQSESGNFGVKIGSVEYEFHLVSYKDLESKKNLWKDKDI